MALISTAEAKQMIPALTGSTEDTLLTSLISAAGQAMAAWCGYPSASVGVAPTMETTTYTRYQDGPGGRLLYLDVWPVVSVTSIYDSEDRRYGADDLVASGDYTLVEGESGLVELDWDAIHGSWSTAPRAIKATYVAGWATVPESLKQAARIAVRALYDKRQTISLTNQNLGGASVGLVSPSHLPDETKQLLSAYRLPRALVPV